MADARAKRLEERVKLFAAALSNVGVAFVVAGLVGPSITGRVNLSAAVGSALLGFGFHLVAQCILHYVVADPQQGGHGGGDR